MSATIQDRGPLGKLASVFFAPQRGYKIARYRTAERHSSLKAGFAIWRARRAVEAELESLSDRELDDIGIARCEIWRVAQGAH